MSGAYGLGKASVWWDRWSPSFCDGVRWHLAISPDGDYWQPLYFRQSAVVDDFGNLVVVPA